MTTPVAEPYPSLPEEAVSGAYARMLAGYALDRTMEQAQALSEKDALIAELEQESEHWYTLANTDELTGLPNRRLFIESLNEQTELHPGGYALAFVDLNGLKAVNDQEGHDKGNKLIQDAGTTMDENTRHRDAPEHPEAREHDILSKATFRLSGDEFGVILVGVTDEKGVEAWKNRIYTALKARGISAAIGARVHRPGETGIQILAAVDTLMYDQKEAGKVAARDARIAAMSPEKLQKAGPIRASIQEAGYTKQELADLFGIFVGRS